MSTAAAFWMSVGASGRLVELSRDECLELLGAMSVGRIAFTTDDGPRVLPVNYILEGELTEEEFGRLRFGKIPEPWAAGPRSIFVRLPCVQLTGRRVIPGGR
jgi:Pyridoxamine 5'-phosphate oxidase